MAMTLRLTDKEEVLLNELSETLGLSKQQTVIYALKQLDAAQIRRNSLDSAFEFVMTHDKALMERLADA